jgi:aldehyde dehydrogenase family 7 protein A1
VTKLIQPILERNGLPGAAAALVCGDIDVGKELVGSPDIPLGELMLGSIIEKSGD